MEVHHGGGLVVAVTRNGEVLFEEGYGYADVANQVRMDPERTVLRVASISKSFTATAVMQLVEQGTLDLDRDINDYLDFQIPAAFGRPVTLRHLLTHTAGFAEWRVTDGTPGLNSQERSLPDGLRILRTAPAVASIRCRPSRDRVRGPRHSP